MKLKDQIEILLGKTDPNEFYEDDEIYLERKDSGIAKNKQSLRVGIGMADT